MSEIGKHTFPIASLWNMAFIGMGKFCMSLASAKMEFIHVPVANRSLATF